MYGIRTISLILRRGTEAEWANRSATETLLKLKQRKIFRHPYWKSFTNRYQNYTRTGTFYVGSCTFFTGSSITLILVYETIFTIRIRCNNVTTVQKIMKELLKLEIRFNIHSSSCMNDYLTQKDYLIQTLVFLTGIEKNNSCLRRLN